MTVCRRVAGAGAEATARASNAKRFMPRRVHSPMAAFHPKLTLAKTAIGKARSNCSAVVEEHLKRGRQMSLLSRTLLAAAAIISAPATASGPSDTARIRALEQEQAAAWNA